MRHLLAMLPIRIVNRLPRRWVYLVVLRAYREYVETLSFREITRATAGQLVNWWGRQAYPPEEERR